MQFVSAHRFAAFSSKALTLLVLFDTGIVPFKLFDSGLKIFNLQSFKKCARYVCHCAGYTRIEAAIPNLGHSLSEKSPYVSSGDRHRHWPVVRRG